MRPSGLIGILEFRSFGCFSEKCPSPFVSLTRTTRGRSLQLVQGQLDTGFAAAVAFPPCGRGITAAATEWSQNSFAFDHVFRFA